MGEDARDITNDDPSASAQLRPTVLNQPSGQPSRTAARSSTKPSSRHRAPQTTPEKSTSLPCGQRPASNTVILCKINARYTPLTRSGNPHSINPRQIKTHFPLHALSLSSQIPRSGTRPTGFNVPSVEGCAVVGCEDRWRAESTGRGL